MDRAEKFRQAVAQHNHGRSRMGRRYPPELRAEALVYCREQRDAGWSWAAISEALEVSPLTLARWRQEAEVVAPAQNVGFREIRILDSPSSLGVAEKLTLVTPEGFRIEGLDAQSVLELLGRLT